MRRNVRRLAFVSLFALAAGAPSSSWAAVNYRVDLPDGSHLQSVAVGSRQDHIPLGSAIHFELASGCACTATVTIVRLDEQPVAITNANVPTDIRSGKNAEVAQAGLLFVQLSVQAAGTTTVESMTIRIDSDTWWSIADTEAYAILRTSGNTAIAGAGIFVDPGQFANAFLSFFHLKTHLPPLQQLRMSFVVHLLPPGETGGAADIGIAPIGVGLFGNRIVMGMGWDISQKGLRPDRHNRYVYVGFSASRLLGAPAALH
jgi:hypothetical protein